MVYPSRIFYQWKDRSSVFDSRLQAARRNCPWLQQNDYIGNEKITLTNCSTFPKQLLYRILPLLFEHYNYFFTLGKLSKRPFWSLKLFFSYQAESNLKFEHLTVAASSSPIHSNAVVVIPEIYAESGRIIFTCRAVSESLHRGWRCSSSNRYNARDISWPSFNRSLRNMYFCNI